MITKSREAILDVYDNSFSELVNKVSTAFSKFDRFYLHKDIFIWLDGGGSSDRENGFAGIRQNIKYDTTRIGFGYIHRGLRHVGYEGTDHEFKVFFYFNYSTYLVSVESNNGEIQKVYGDQLTDKEIDEIVKRELQKHKNEIEATITRD